MRKVAETFEVSLGFIHHVLDLYRRCGKVTVVPLAAPRHERHTRTTTDEDCIRSLVKAGPSIYLDEIREELDFSYGVSVLLVEISRNVLKKSLPRNAAECNEELRTLWKLGLAQLNGPGLAGRWGPSCRYAQISL